MPREGRIHEKAFQRGVGRRRQMIAAVAVSGVIGGTALAYCSERFPRHRTMVETIAGFLLIGGFGLIGFGFGCAVGMP
jgi:hypothetical protein